MPLTLTYSQEITLRVTIMQDIERLEKLAAANLAEPHKTFIDESLSNLRTILENLKKR